MKVVFVSVLFSGLACALRAEPIRCDVNPLSPTSSCTITYFDRTKNLIYPASMTAKQTVGNDPKDRDPSYVQAIRGGGTKILYSGSILRANFPFTTCGDQDWRVVAMARESSNILIYGPADVSEFCQKDGHLIVVLPVTTIWAELYHSTGNAADPLRKAPSPLMLTDAVAATDTAAAIQPQAQPYCVGLDVSRWKPGLDEATDIRPCDRYSWISFMYNAPAGPIWNSWTQPGASQGSVSYTPGIGQIATPPSSSGVPAGFKKPSQSLTFDVQEYPSQRWGYGYIGFPLIFEKANTATSNLNSLIFGISYDIPLAVSHPNRKQFWFSFRPPDFRLQYGPELGVETPHDLNLTAAASARFPIVINIKRQPSALVIFPAVGFETGNHIVTHTISGLQSDANPIFRFVYGWDSSLRVPFIATHAFLGDKPTTIDFAWRTRRLAYPEPFTDYVSGQLERLAKHPMSYWRGSWIVPFSQLASFKVTVQHGGLPPDFDYLGYSVNVGLTLGNPGYTEH